MSGGWNSDEERRMFQIAANSVQSRTVSRGRGGRGRCAPRSRNGQPPPLIMQGPVSYFGKIIGRGGANIKQLQQSSGAEIYITNEGDFVKATVFGNPDARKNAQTSLEAIMNSMNIGERQRERTPSPPRQNQYVQETSNEPIDWDKANEEAARYREQKIIRLGPIIKKLYREHPEVTAMSDMEVNAWRKSNFDITAVNLDINASNSPPPVPKPTIKFEHAFADHPEILQEIYKQGFTQPSPIQAQMWPALLDGRDVIGIAQTGTGKTLAFLLPALLHIEAQTTPRSQRKGPNVLILAPTRELASQIQNEVSKYSYKGIKAACIYGGVSKKQQIEKLASGIEILIATPGRLNDLIDSEFVDMEAITYLVLDEADRMLDMGFEPQIRRSLVDVRTDRQTVMTSATWPSSVRRLAKSFTNDGIQVVVGSLDLAAVHTVSQKIVILDEEEKYNYIKDFLKKMPSHEKAIIFCSKKFTTIELCSNLGYEGFDFRSIYGGLDQSDREQSVADVHSGVSNVLIATDVASRGLDIDGVTYVINYDFPHAMEEYVHRVGRTGRAGKLGTAISYFTRSNWGKAAELITILEEASQEVPEELHNMAARFSAMKERKDREGGGRGRRSNGDFNRFY